MTLEENPDRRTSVPPTRLKNPALIRPFEMFVRMYGLPNYNEFDPTLFVALTYSIIFGAMFGDVGQGLCLALGGFLLYRFKKANLAAILSCCGPWFLLTASLSSPEWKMRSSCVLLPVLPLR